MEEYRGPSPAVMLAFCIATSALVSYVVTERYFQQHAPFVVGGSSSSIESLRQAEPDIADIVSDAEASVVAVSVSVDTAFVPKRLSQELPEPSAQELREKRRHISEGSGFFVSPEGLVVTNRHVIDMPDVPLKARHVSIRLNTGESLETELAALDPVLDVAVLRVSSSSSQPFPVLQFASSSEVRVGQTVIAIGNALSEFPNTVTRGVVSGLNRRVWAGDDVGEEIIEEAIQTDAAINPGNSGGPLLDAYGRVIGMNTAVAEDGQSLGFALPGDAILRSVESVKQYGRIVRPFLGVRYELLDDGGAEIISGEGLDELAVHPGSPADQAGLREHDMIVSIDGVKVDERHTPVSLIGKHQVGDLLQVEVLRENEQKIFSIPLSEYLP